MTSGRVNVGADLLADAIDAQAVPVTRVDWRPPMDGTESDLATVAADPRRPEANARALAAMLEVTATLVDVVPASEALGLEPGQFLHAGPPIEWARASGPLRGALMGGAALEGLVEDPEDAVALFESGTSVSRSTRATTTRRSARWPASSRRACGCGCSRTRPAGGVRTARSTRGSARCCGTAPTAPRC